MLDLQGRKLIQIVAVLVFGILVVQGVAVRKILLEKAALQLTVVEGLDRWKQQYLAVSESRDRWNKQYSKLDTINGIGELTELINLRAYDLDADPDTASVTQAVEIMHGPQSNVPLGLVQRCLANSSGDRNVFEVSAPTYQALMAGIDKLARRPDISIGNISVKGDNRNPVGRLGDFCILLRSD